MNAKEHAEAAAQLADEMDRSLDADGASLYVLHLLARAWTHARLAVLMRALEGRLNRVRTWLEKRLDRP